MSAAHLRDTLPLAIALLDFDRTADFDFHQVSSRSLSHSKNGNDTGSLELGDIGYVDALEVSDGTGLRSQYDHERDLRINGRVSQGVLAAGWTGWTKEEMPWVQQLGIL